MTEPFTRWDAEVSFNAAELAVVLGALDQAVEDATDAAALRVMRGAQLVIWRKLWPELAEQYEDEAREEEE